jgi:hypothetical protein
MDDNDELSWMTKKEMLVSVCAYMYCLLSPVYRLLSWMTKKEMPVRGCACVCTLWRLYGSC